MLDAFKNHVKETFPFLKEAKVIIACSGGMDSVVLAHLGKTCGWDMALAHCNFNLRENESLEDARFVENLCDTWSVSFFTKSFETEKEAKNYKGSIQMLARELRYSWFEELLQQTPYTYVLTAHHLEDSLETFLINLARGTGLDGLTGIPAMRSNFLRPLLSFSKEDLRAYAKNLKLEWREDRSNASTKYTRNAIRHTIVPNLKTLYPNFLDNFSKTQSYLKESAVILEQLKLELRQKLFKRGTGAEVFSIEVSALEALQPLGIYIPLLFKDFGFTAWKDIQQLTTAMGGKEVHSATHRLIRHREFLLLTPKNIEDNKEYHIAKGQELFKGPVHIRIQEVSEMVSKNMNTIYVDTQKLKFPLLLRKWKTGDYFYPFGMQGKKKLSKYFKDEKMSALGKETQWILYSGEDVVWVIAKRADNRFKVSKNTKSITKLELVT